MVLFFDRNTYITTVKQCYYCHIYGCIRSPSVILLNTIICRVGREGSRARSGNGMKLTLFIIAGRQPRDREMEHHCTTAYERGCITYTADCNTIVHLGAHFSALYSSFIVRAVRFVLTIEKIVACQFSRI